jgi:uncharacterized protein
MSERDGYGHGVPCWVDIAHRDPDAAVRFYGDVFGWEFTDPAEMPGDPPGRYFVARLRGRDVAGISSRPSEGAPPSPAWSTYICVDSADEAVQKARDAGGSVVLEPFDVLPAGRMAVLADPAGAVFCAWEPRDRRGAELVNEPGAWSMSALNMRDPDAAKTFYDTVFGWTTDTFEVGDMAIPLFRLPGFEGGEPEQPVPRDVVATMAPLPDGTVDVPPHWSVDFWVDDVDATAERVTELGGDIVVAPYDLPVGEFRQAVVADPAGATFSVSKVGPPA